MTSLSQSRLPAMIYALAAFVLFSTGDAMARSMADQWPVTAMACVRYGAAALALAGILLWREGRAGFAIRLPLIHFGRGCAIACAGTLFWLSLGFMPLADATAIQFTSPFCTAILSALFLGERVGWRQEMLMATGFVGVIIVLQPNVMALGAVALLPLGCAIGMAALMILNRLSAGSASVLGSQVLLAAGATLVLAPVTLLGHLSGVARFTVGTPPAIVIAIALSIAILGTVGHAMLYRATLRAPAVTIAPMGYVQILCAVLYGSLLFNTPPTASMLLGALVIIGSGWLLIRANLRTAKAVVETGTSPD